MNYDSKNSQILYSVNQFTKSSRSIRANLVIPQFALFKRYTHFQMVISLKPSLWYDDEKGKTFAVGLDVLDERKETVRAKSHLFEQENFNFPYIRCEFGILREYTKT